MDVYTVGHSTHIKEEFLKLLKVTKIEMIVDVRAFPRSRKFPHFHKDQMKVWLPEENIDYLHIKELGGRRNKSKSVDDDVNDAWNNRSFHNYADYTLQKDFQNGLEKLKKQAKEKNVAYLCSERHPSRCHRLLISNWLALHGWGVYHIIDGPKGKTKIVKHKPDKWGAPPKLNDEGEVVNPNTNEIDG